MDQRRLGGERGDSAVLMQEFWEVFVVQIAADMAERIGKKRTSFAHTRIRCDKFNQFTRFANLPIRIFIAIDLSEIPPYI